MNQYEFEQYLDAQPPLSGTRPIGHFVKNVFGRKERVVLPETYWRYLAWMEEEQNIDTRSFIAECDKKRGDLPLSEGLMEWLYYDMTERQRKNEKLPGFLKFMD